MPCCIHRGKSWRQGVDAVLISNSSWLGITLFRSIAYRMHPQPSFTSCNLFISFSFLLYLSRKTQDKIAVRNITPLNEANSMRIDGSFETGDNAIPNAEPIAFIRIKIDTARLRMDFGALVYAYSIPVVIERISVTASMAKVGIWRKTFTWLCQLSYLCHDTVIINCGLSSLDLHYLALCLHCCKVLEVDDRNMEVIYKSLYIRLVYSW